MRIVLDLQAVQSGADAAARLKAMARAKALLRAGTAHDVLILLNASCPDTAEEIRQAFDGLLPPARFRLFHPPPKLRARGGAKRPK
jgi:hypothetical protein